MQKNSQSLISLSLLVVLFGCGKQQGSQTPRTSKITKGDIDAAAQLNPAKSNTAAPEPASRFIINDGCPLDDQITSIQLISRGRKLADYKITSEIKASENPLKDTLMKLFRSPKETAVAHEIDNKGINIPMEFYTEPTTREEAIALNGASKDWSSFTITLLDKKNEQATTPLTHLEGIPQDSTEGAVSYLFVNRGEVNYPVSSSTLLSDLSKIVIEKKVFSSLVKNSCIGQTKCGEGGIGLHVAESNRYQLEELEVKINTHTIFKGDIRHIFTHYFEPSEIEAPLGKPKTSTGRNTSIDLASSAVFKKFIADNTTQCARK